ncbi:MAG TPA: hypothetical protein VKT75_05740 [Acidobacteriaceae bacterium]|nr:hypothetical protein [Acidobacteriaceae bacterium]
MELERPDKRDENLVVNARDRTVGIRSEGAGVTPVSHEQLMEPVWIAALKKRIAKEEEE